MRKPIGVTAGPLGKVIVLCDDGSLLSLDVMGGEWQELVPVPGTQAARGTSQAGKDHLDALRGKSETASIVDQKF